MLAFFGEARLPATHPVAAEDVPEPFRGLLDHHDHMTVALEAFHNSPVVVRPYLVHQQGDLYGRKLDLLSEKSGEVVMTGIMLLNLTFVPLPARERIIAQEAPLGRILIESGVLRRITGVSLLKVDAADPLAKRFGLDEPVDAYGRLATILCDEKPAVDLLEIVRPET